MRFIRRFLRMKEENQPNDDYFALCAVEIENLKPPLTKIIKYCY